MFKQQDPFKIFTLEPIFNIDKTLVEAKYIELLKQWHPDKAQENSQKLQFVQAATNITDAYNLLVNDYKRANFLYQRLVSETPNQTVNEKVINPNILMMQFELRSKVAKLKDDFDFEEFLKLSDTIADLKKSSYNHAVEDFSSQDLQKIYDSVVQLRYIEKLEEELEVINSMQTNF